jgi:glycosyltransferase involved in cell wall biosynthesis
VTILLNLLTLVPGHMGGTETYVRELIRELAAGRLDVVTLVSPAGRGFSSPLTEVVAERHPSGSSSLNRARCLTEGILRGRHLQQLTPSAAVVHYPLTVPLPRAGRGAATVVTLADVQHHDLPHLFSRRERAYRAVAYDRAAREADAVVTISGFSKERIVECLGVPHDRVHVIPLGVREEEFPPRSTADREPFVLYPAKGWPHKNHETLFQAFTILRDSMPHLRLVLTGTSRGEVPEPPEGVDVKGQVPRPELAALYSRASALVFPSLYEGFGLPVLEAMTSGCPVAAAKRGALPEVVGDAAVLFDPEEPQAIATALAEALARAPELSARGRQRARAFSWELCGARHAALYSQLGG